jgi:drug/metabolite transporter (DMT)-like permease
VTSSVLHSDRARGYGMVAFSYVVMGAIGALVLWADAPESMVLVLRMGIAFVALAIFFARPWMWREIRRPGVLKLLLLMGVLDSGTLLLFFISMRLTNVAIGMFVMFLSPLWVALLVPPILKQRTDRIVFPALGLAMGGLAFIIVPPMIGEELRLSVWGIVAGLLAGVLLAGFMMCVSELRRTVRAATVVTTECALDTLLVLPLAVWQTFVSGNGLTTRDLLSGLILGVVCTAFTYMIWTEGVGFIPVQHVPILGYLEPLSAPLYALVLVGEWPSWTTLVGGLLIVAAGVLVVLKGEKETAAEAAAAPEA